MAIIYKITNKINGKQYVGFSKNTLEKRWKQHLRDAKRKDTHFANAIRNYGKDAWTLETVVQADDADWLHNVMEPHYIRLWNLTDRSVGYNSTFGGDGGVPSKETRKKISESRKGKCVGIDNPFYGRKHTEETKKILKEKKQGNNHNRLGKKHSPETLERMRQARINYHKNKKGIIE